MGEIDERIITGAMKKFGISRKRAEKCLTSLVDDGFVKPGLDNFSITKSGIECIEEAIKKGEKGI
jgi:predicted transcriptional regulator